MIDATSSTAIPAPSWRPTREIPPLVPGSVQLWRLRVPAEEPRTNRQHPSQADTDRGHSADNVAAPADARADAEMAAEGARLESLITDDERERRARFRRIDDRHRFGRARGLLRTLLASPSIGHAADVCFTLGPSGKPFLPAQASGAPARVRFNVSHSHEWVLIGLALDCEVGVDVEHHDPRGELLDLARRFFSAREVAALEARPPALRNLAFYATWACKESFVKVIGEGLSAGLDRFSVLGAAEGRFEIVLRWESSRNAAEARARAQEREAEAREAQRMPAAPPSGALTAARQRQALDEDERGLERLGDASRWTIRLLDMGPEYAAAVAVEGPPPHLHLLEWR